MTDMTSRSSARKDSTRDGIEHRGTEGALLTNLQPRWGSAALAFIIVVTAVVEARTAMTRPFWYDELCTVAVASQHSAAAIWSALASAVDAQPFFFHMVSAAGAGLAGGSEFGYRLPGLVGFLWVPVCLYVFVARRAGVIAGLIAAIIPILSGFEPYAAEARPYGFWVGCLAVALVCWQQLERSRWAVVPFAVALWMAVASHYYGILSVPAFVLGEAIRWHRTRQLRLAVWIPLALCVAPLFFALPLIRTIRTTYGDHFWAQNNRLFLLLTYSQLTGLGEVLTAGIMFILFVLLVNLSFPVIRRAQPWIRPQPNDRIRPEECVAALYLLTVPIVTSIALTLTHGGMVMRYVLPTVLGLSIATAFVVTDLGANIAPLVLAVLIVSFGFSYLGRGLFVFRGQSGVAVENSALPAVERLIAPLPPDIPVVVSSGLDYLPLAFYAGPATRNRLVNLVDPKEALAAINTDTVDINGPLLARYLPLNVRDFSAFRATHHRFFLLSSGNTFDWWPGRFVREGHTVTLRGAAGGYRLYEVVLAG
jgi:hypothetical protein